MSKRRHSRRSGRGRNRNPLDAADLVRETQAFNALRERADLARSFVKGLAAHFERNAEHLFDDLFTRRKPEYAKLILALLPKDGRLTDNALPKMTEAEIACLIRAGRAEEAQQNGAGGAGASAPTLGGLRFP
jgi:hypothetical protein